MFLIFCAYAVAFWYGARLVQERTISIGDLFVAFFCTLIGAMGLGQSAPAFTAFTNAQGAAPRVFEIITRESKINPFSQEGEKPTSCDGEIDFRDVTFNYESRASDGGAPVLRNLNLRIKAGTTHALVGPSGCGKSSTMSLIERFYDTVDGSVCIDGRDVRDLNVRWLRSQMGYVGQVCIIYLAEHFLTNRTMLYRCPLCSVLLSRKTLRSELVSSSTNPHLMDGYVRKYQWTRSKLQRRRPTLILSS